MLDQVDKVLGRVTSVFRHAETARDEFLNSDLLPLFDRQLEQQNIILEGIFEVEAAVRNYKSKLEDAAFGRENSSPVQSLRDRIAEIDQARQKTKHIRDALRQIMRDREGRHSFSKSVLRVLSPDQERAILKAYDVLASAFENESRKHAHELSNSLRRVEVHIARTQVASEKDTKLEVLFSDVERLEIALKSRRQRAQAKLAATELARDRVIAAMRRE